MANNYKVKTYSNSTTGTSQALFTASAATTLVKSVIVNCDKTTPNVNAILRIKKSGGTEEMIKRQNITLQTASYEMLYDVLPLEVGDALYAQSDDTDITWIMSWVENTTSVIGQSIDVLSDVDTTGKANGDVLTYNSTTGNWEAEASAGGSSFGTIAVAGQSNVVADASNDTLTLTAGTGITITTNASTDTVTITNSATGANAFGNVAVAGQTTVAADSTNDTLTIAAGTGITLTTDATTDTVTITNSVTAPNTFGTIAVATQSNVVADSTTDTLTFAAAGGMTITTDATTDTITLDSARLDDDDVTLSGIREIDLNGENLNIVNGSLEILMIEADGVRQANTVIADYAGTVGGKITLAEATANGGSSIAIQAPASLAASTTYTLPSADGTSGQVLATDSTGGLSWATRSSLAFSTIAVAGQSNVVADSASDTLTLAAGSGITITTDAGADSVTITASGGGTPAGTTGQVQYNNAGAFGAEAALFYDATNNRLSVGGNTSPTGTITSRGAGTTTGVGFQTENSSGVARVVILDEGTMTITEATSGMASTRPTISLKGNQTNYFRPCFNLEHNSLTTPFTSLNVNNKTGGSITINDWTTGGIAATGTTSNSAGATPFFFAGYHGSTTPTAAAILFQFGKHNGSASATALASTEVGVRFSNFGTVNFVQLGSGATGIRNTAPTSTTTLTVRGQGTGTNECLRAEDNSGTARFVVRDDGGFAFSGGTIGAAQTGYTTFTNLTTDRTCDANATTVEELADILGTLIVDLKTKGIIAA